MSMFRRFVKDDSGATAIEYGLIAALVSVAIIVMLGTLGENLNATFKTVADQLEGAGGGGGGGRRIEGSRGIGAQAAADAPDRTSALPPTWMTLAERRFQ